MRNPLSDLSVEASASPFQSICSRSLSNLQIGTAKEKRHICINNSFLVINTMGVDCLSITFIGAVHRSGLNCLELSGEQKAALKND